MKAGSSILSLLFSYRVFMVLSVSKLYNFIYLLNCWKWPLVSIVFQSVLEHFWIFRQTVWQWFFCTRSEDFTARNPVFLFQIFPVQPLSEEKPQISVKHIYPYYWHCNWNAKQFVRYAFSLTSNVICSSTSSKKLLEREQKSSRESKWERKLASFH